MSEPKLYVNSINDGKDYKIRTHYLTIHSKDRDRTIYPNIDSYRFDFMKTFGRVYKDIVSISLFGGVFPNVGTISDEPYLLLNIKELTGSGFRSTNQEADSAFAMILIDKNVGDFFNLRNDFCRAMNLEMAQRGLPNLSSMTITITNQSGAAYNFGTDNGGSPDLTLQHTLIFEIKTLEKTFNYVPKMEK